MKTLFEKIYGVEPYKDIRTASDHSKYFVNYKPLYRHKNAFIAKSNVKKIKDQELLVQIVNDNETAKGVSDLALSKISDKQVIINALRFWIRIPKEKFEKKLDEILIAEVTATSDPARLAEFARTEGAYTGSNAVRFAAVDRINDLATLESIALDVTMRYTPVRVHAADRIALLGGKRPEKLTHWTELVKFPWGILMVQPTFTNPFDQISDQVSFPSQNHRCGIAVNTFPIRLRTERLNDAVLTG